MEFEPPYFYKLEDETLFTMKTIMLVDDKEISNFIMKKYLDIYLPDTQVIEHTNPQKALEEVAMVNPDMILLDLAMPLFDGWDFLENLRQQNLNIAVAILTTSISDVDRQRAMEYDNVVKFFIKPIDPQQVPSLFDY